eukprot:m.14262 g.14262  ORF g.14262 m.14262 type:complete len:606 (+) comp7821_c0_seq1:917-2734(+)
MPKVDIKRDLLFKLLGRSFTQAEFEDLCFEFGLELDDVLTEKIALQREQGDKAVEAKEAEGLSEEVIYKLDIPANRYDLLCIEGVVRGLKIFKKEVQSPHYSLSDCKQRQKMFIKPDTKRVRPHAVAAVLRNIVFTKERYDSFIDLQDKLHANICRKRTLVAIGTHDLDTIQGPFTYDAQRPEDISFKPLRAPDMTKEYRADELMKAYEEDAQLKHFLHIIKDKEVYPVIRDKNGVVLSLPPIINGHHSRLTLNTRNVFIECTATDLTKAKTVLNILVCMFSEYCAEPFVVEPVDVVTPEGVTNVYPEFGYRTEKVQSELICRRMGLPPTPAASLADMLTRMQLTASVDPDGQTLLVEVPPTRPDVIHQCDIWEDCAIAYGYNNIKWTQPKVHTVGKQLPVNKLTDQLRAVVAQAGYDEALTFALCRHDDNYASMRRTDTGDTTVVISNPATAEFQVARSNLVSGLLRTLFYNVGGRLALPVKIFEISDVVVKDSSCDTGARNNRRLAAAICNTAPDFEAIQGLLDYVMKMLGVQSNLTAKPGHPEVYELRASQDPAFFGELGAADIFYKGQRVGVLGVVHPEVLANYELKAPCSALELDIEPFL